MFIRYDGPEAVDPVLGLAWSNGQIREVSEKEQVAALLAVQGFTETKDRPLPRPSKPHVSEPLDPGPSGKATFEQGLPIEGAPDREE
jgi:hypothetical protein